MSKGAKFVLFLFIIGLLCFIAGLGDAMLVIKGDKLDFNSAQKADFEQETMVEGEINFALGPFTTYYESETYFGVIKGKKKATNYYLVGTKKDFGVGDISDETFVVFSTSDKDISSSLTSLSNKWVSYVRSNGKTQLPTETVSFSGKLSQQSTDAKYEEYRKEMLDAVEMSDGDIPLLKITEGKLGIKELAICFGGAAVALISAIIFIVSLVSASKAKRRSQLY